MDIIEFIRKTPKAELHLHIEGTLEPDHMFTLAKRNNIKIPFANVNDVKSAYKFSNLESFLKIFYQGSRVLIKEQDFFDLTWAYAIKCKEDNVVHTEIFFAVKKVLQLKIWPQSFFHLYLKLFYKIFLHFLNRFFFQHQKQV